jgi:hypothetical protein
MNGQQYGQQQQYQQAPPPQGYPVHQAPPAQPFKLPKMVGYILIMIAVIFIPMGMIIQINAEGSDAADTIKMGMNIEQIGVLLAAVFTMIFLAGGGDLDKFEKLGLLLFLGVVIMATTGISLASFWS